MKLCDYGCGKEAKFQISSGRWCCENNSSKCSSIKEKISNSLKNKKYERFNPSLYRKKCTFCDFITSVNVLKYHEKKCYLNPKNLKFCEKCGKPIKNIKRLICDSCFDVKSIGNKISNSLLIYNQNKDYETIKNNPFEKLPKRLIYKILYDERGNKCEECGYEYTDEKTGKGPFEIHHLDGNNKNWKKENLKILCLNCHWKTDNWRFRGKQHSIKNRKILSRKTKNHYLKIKNSEIV